MRALFPIQCSGRNSAGFPALSKPVVIQVCVTKLGDSGISVSVQCPFNTGAHGQRCKASHPTVDKIGEGISCPYAVDLPSGLEHEKVHRLLFEDF